MGVEQRQVKLYVQGLFVKLNVKDTSSPRASYMLVKIEHEIVRDDRITGRKKCNEPVDKVSFGGVIFERKSTTSIENRFPRPSRVLIAFYTFHKMRIFIGRRLG